MGRHQCSKKVDLCLKSDTETQLPAESPEPLLMLLKTCEYIVSTSVVETRKKHRELKAKGSVANGKVIIVIEGETIKNFEFENDSFNLKEDLNKGDKIVFLYQGNDTVVDMKAQIAKK